MSRNTLFLISLLLLFSVASAARREPADSTHQTVVDVEEEGCEGVGEEECLMRRTLIAHTDYIYTQKKKSP